MEYYIGFAACWVIVGIAYLVCLLRMGADGEVGALLRDPDRHLGAWIVTMILFALFCPILLMIKAFNQVRMLVIMLLAFRLCQEIATPPSVKTPAAPDNGLTVH